MSLDRFPVKGIGQLVEPAASLFDLVIGVCRIAFTSSCQEPAELRTQQHCVEDHGVVAVQVQAAYLQKGSVLRGSDQQTMRRMTR